MTRFGFFVLCMLFATACSNNNPQEYFKQTGGVVIDVLCNTALVKDMSDAYMAYEAQVKEAKSKEEATKLQKAFGDSLDGIWLKQKYDLKPYPGIAGVFQELGGNTMEFKVQVAALWVNAAVQKCPAKLSDQRASTSAAMSLIAIIAKQ